jgi:hypothetical protein
MIEGLFELHCAFGVFSSPLESLNLSMLVWRLLRHTVTGIFLLSVDQSF